MRWVRRGLWIAAWGVWAWLGVGLYHELPRKPGALVHELNLRFPDDMPVGFVGNTNRLVVARNLRTKNEQAVELFDIDSGKLLRHVPAAGFGFMDLFTLRMAKRVASDDSPMAPLGSQRQRFRSFTIFRDVQELRIGIERSMTEKTNETYAHMQSTLDIEGIRRLLTGMDEVLAVAHAAVEPFEWRVRQSGLVGLVRLIIDQQVSVAAADAIWRRFQSGVGKVTAKDLIKFDAATLKSFGLSRPKAAYVLGIAEAEKSGAIDFAHLNELRDEEAIEKLTALKGVGGWTAEVYLMFCEGRTDLFPAGDLALQEGFRLAGRKRRRPTEKALYARAERWRPNRGVAALLLWSYYRAVRSGQVSLPNPKLARPEKKTLKK